MNKTIVCDCGHPINAHYTTGGDTYHCWQERGRRTTTCKCDKSPQDIAAALLARAEQAEATSESRRKTLMEKEEELRKEWKRAENAEAERDKLASLIVIHYENEADMKPVYQAAISLQRKVEG